MTAVQYNVIKGYV